MVLIFGCDSNNSGPNDSNLPGDGTASYAISGNLTKQFEGRAFFAVGSDVAGTTSGIGLILYRTTAQDTSLVVFASEGTNTTPSAREYAIVLDTSGAPTLDPDEFVSFFTIRGSGLYITFAEEGTLTVSASSADQLKGTFNFNEQGVDLTSPTATGDPVAMNGSSAAARTR